jgi:hypothetical protein
MLQTISVKTDSGRRERFYVVYDMDQHGMKSIVGVHLPGDLLNVTDKLSQTERARIQSSLNRKRRA